MTCAGSNRTGIARSLFAIIVLGLGSTGPSAAWAARLKGLDLTGLESGSQTLSVTIPNISAFTEIFGISCFANAGHVNPGSTDFGQSSEVGGPGSSRIASAIALIPRRSWEVLASARVAPVCWGA